MAIFRFPLEAVLRQRESIEQDRQFEVAELERKRIAIERRISDMQLGMASDRLDLADQLASGTIALSALRLHAMGSFGMERRVERAAIELAGVMEQLEAARARLLDAMTARKAISQLKERRRAAWQREQDRRESAMLDDLSATRSALAACGPGEHDRGAA